MIPAPPVILRLATFTPELNAALAARGRVIDAASIEANRHAIRIAVTSGTEGIAADLVEQLPSLGLIAINGVGHDAVDVAHAAARGIAVTNTPDVLTDDVADLAVALILGLGRKVAAADAFVRDGHWEGAAFPLARKVSGRRFGIVGLGRIGSAIAARLRAFGPVAYTGRAPKSVDLPFYPDVQALAAASDVLIVAASASAATRHLIDAKALAALGADGWLVNIARGSLVDEATLVAALASGAIAGAALDVFANEPAVPRALVDSDRTLLTPHIASATTETRGAMAALMLANIDAFLAGDPLPTPVMTAG